MSYTYVYPNRFVQALIYSFSQNNKTMMTRFFPNLTVGFLAATTADGFNIPTNIQTKQRTLPSLALSDENVVGLTDDGDFAISGVNIGQQQPQSSELGGDLASILGLSSVSAINDAAVEPPAPVFPAMVSPTPLPAPVPTPVPEISVQKGQPPVVSEEQLERVQEWLMTSIPTLMDNDIELYADNLCLIGFDPECVSSGELLLEDLNFMKLLHQRYLYKQITTSTNR